MHFWNEKFGEMQEVNVPRKVFLLFFDQLSIWEKYKVFYDQQANVFWVVQTTSLLYRIIMLIVSLCLSILYGIFILIITLISFIFHQDLWNDFKADVNDYIQEIKELLFAEKYGKFYSFWVTEQSGNRYATLKSYLNK